MLTSGLQPLLDMFVRFARTHSMSMSAEEAARLITETLLTDRALLQACRCGIVTREEVLDALVGRFHVEALEVPEDARPSLAAWVELRAALAPVLFAALDRGP